MRILTTSLILVLFGLPVYAQTVHFSNPPLGGTEGKDFFIVNYVDHDTTSGLRNYECGDKTYDGHQGTDFLIRSFKTMDSGVTIFAVANGRVFYTSDTLFDRNKHTNPGGFGNYIGINHQNQYYTYYAHIMKHSSLVHVGDSVVAGQAIAKVGCAGNCTDPHVHLEVWDNIKLVDPFAGTCQTATSSMWVTQPFYDTSLLTIDLGFVPYVPNLDTLRERYLVRDTFYRTKDTTVCFWTQMQGLHIGDSTRVDWYSPTGTYWYSYTYVVPADWWYDYFWTYINMPDTAGTWTTKYYVKNTLVSTSHFYVTTPTGIEPVSTPTYRWDVGPNPCNSNVYINGVLPAGEPIYLTDMTGRIISAYPAQTRILDVSALHPGLYLLRCASYVKKVLKE